MTPTRVRIYGAPTTQDAALDESTGTYRARIDLSDAPNGTNTLYANITWTPAGDSSRTYQSEHHDVTVVDAVAPVVTTPEPATTYRSNPTTWSTAFLEFRYQDGSNVPTRRYWITDQAGNTVITEGSFTRTGSCGSTYCYLYFYGTDDTGKLLPPGTYTVHTVFTDAAGNTTNDVTGTITLDGTTPGTLTTPTDGGTLVGTAPFEFTPTNDASVKVTRVRVRVRDTSISIYNPSPDGIWRTTFPVGSLEAGPATLTTITTWTDPSGRSVTYTSGEWSVGVDPTSIPLNISLTPEAGTAPLDAELTLTTSHPNSEPLSVTVNWGDGSPLARHTLTAPYAVPTYAHRFQQPGTHKVVVTVGDTGGTFASSSASIVVAGAVNSPPTGTMQLHADTVLAGNDLGVTFSASDPEGGPLTYRVDFGDGSSPATGSYDQPLQLSHRYTAPGWYVVRGQASDGHNTISRTLRVQVLLPAPLVARAGDDLMAATGQDVKLDASGSTPFDLITSFEWRLDGNVIGTEPTLTRSFLKQGRRTIRLTVRSGDQTATDDVVITTYTPPPASGFEVTVRSDGSPVAGAQAAVIQPDGTRQSAVTNGEGVALVTGLSESGTITAYVEAPGYRPAAVTGTLVEGRAEAEVDLEPGVAGAATVDHRPLTYDEIVEAGIDPEAPENQHVYEATLNLYFEPKPGEPAPPTPADPPRVLVTGTGVTCIANCEPTNQPGGGSGESCEPTCSQIISGGAVWRPSVQYVEDKPVIQWLVVPMRATFLKEFFDVSMVVQNLTAPDFTFQGGAGSITLPDGLSLAPTTATQSPTIEIPDIPGGQSRQASWTVRGDVEGDYPVMVDYLATVEPLGTTIHLSGRSASPLKVWGASALDTTIKVDREARRWGPFTIDVEMTNVSPVSVYNVSFELLPRPVDAPEWQAPYLFAPLPPRKQHTGEIPPGSTFRASYTLFPGLGNDDVTELVTRLERSFIQKTGGDVDLAPELAFRDAPPVVLKSGDVTTDVTDDVAVITWPRTIVSETPTPLHVARYQLWATQSLQDNDWFLVSDQAAASGTEQSYQLTAKRRSVGRYFAVGTVLSDGSVHFVHTLGEGAPRYVALGDSYSSGEGVPVFEDGTAKDLPVANPSGEGNTCHRSAQGSYSRILAGQRGRAAQLLPSSHQACSGAIAAWLDQPNADNAGEERQLDNLSDFTDVVTLTMGGNDIGFAEIAKSCVLWMCDWGLVGQEVLGSNAWLNTGADYFEGVSLAKDLIDGVVDCIDPRDLAGKVKCAWKRDLDERARTFLEYAAHPERRVTPRNLRNGVLAQRLSRSYLAVLREAPNARILVAGYPQLVTEGDAAPCELFPSLVEGAGLFELTRPERAAVRRVVDDLNGVIETAISDLRRAGHRRIQYVDATAAGSPFAGHELCRGATLNADTHFNSIVDPLLNDVLNPQNAGPQAYSLHPNADGHQSYAQLFASALSTDLAASVRVPQGAEVEAGAVDVSAGATAARFETSWSGSTVTMRLRNPSGQLVATDAKGVTSGSTATSQWIEVAEPAVGTWTVALFGDDVPADGEPTDVRTYVDVPAPSPLNATATAARPSGNTFTFTAAAPDAGEAATYEWTFSDGARATGATVHHTFERTTARSAAVHVRDGSRSAYADVAIADDATIPTFAEATPPPTVTVGAPYSYRFIATGSPTPTFSVVKGQPPAGLSLSGAGILSGTPTAPGTYTFVVRASNDAGADDTGDLTVVVTAASDPNPDPTPSPVPDPELTPVPSPSPAPDPSLVPTPTPAPTPPPMTLNRPTLRVLDARSVRPSASRNSYAKFIVVLTGAPDKAVTVWFTTVDGSAKAPSDFTRLRTKLTFEPGRTRHVLRVRVKRNRLGESVESFTGQLSRANGGIVVRPIAAAIIKRR
ncbi:PKD domain-containing protein [Nocardioides sp. GCM10028917]|uniref:PKD domain-containing protein n=1 Tax=Nocardioides sp. GCM10028917 TaxID=3273408 RepID=UPI003611D358